MAGGAVEPFFFFSYAHRDHQAGGGFVDQFFSDLKDELARLEPAAGPDGLGYRDTERLRLGDDWEQQLSGRVASCRTLVALYSPAYFASAYCGKEWTAFNERVLRHQELTGRTVPALIPVLWEPPPAELPAEVLRIQYLQHDLGEAYAVGGLRALLRADPYGAEYLQVVRVIAQRVREAAGQYLGESPALDLGRVEGCFPVPATEPPSARPGLVRLFVAAGRAARSGGPPVEPPGGGWYGPQPWDWAPYHPPVTPSLVAQAQRVITRAGHVTTMAEIGPGLARDLDRAREDNQVSVLLVDPWAAGREPYRQALREYDDQNHPVTGVLVPVGTDDPSEGPDRAQLWEGVRAVFPRNWLHRAGPEPLFRVRVPRERFESELLRAVTVAQNRLLDEAEGDDDPYAVRASFGLEPDAPTLPGLAVPAGPVPGPRGPRPRAAGTPAPAVHPPGRVHQPGAVIDPSPVADRPSRGEPQT
ncbi:TIR-like protein FxsC [Kitasatospora sp. NPDC101157]|uniref:TIR-like protein FxsC n=1 Tax=Kitasatospora sp. NPDC101157 TaxID=3364098 RepID=UPI0037F115BC